MMSSAGVNDENQGICPVRKHIAPETAADIFALDQPTGRPSILRQSQAENLNKNVPKGVKVCFQTPRRDPVTRKIMSPSRVGKMASLDDCTALLESLSLTSSEAPPPLHASTAPVDVPKNETPYPDDEMPIQSKGGYTIDFDNMELMNPFQGTTKIILSPCQHAPSNTVTPPVPEQPDEIPLAASAFEVEKVEEKQALVDMALDETVLLSQSVENSLADISSDIPSTDTTVIIRQRRSETPVLDHSSNDIENLKVHEQASYSESVVGKDASEAQESPLPPKGVYSFDFDNLDSVNPFDTGVSKLQNSPPISRKAPVSNSPRLEMVEHGKAAPEDVKTVPQISSLLEVKPTVIVESSSAIELPPKASSVLLEVNVDTVSEVPVQPEVKPAIAVSTSEAEKSPLPPKGAYSFDFDALDSVNPFQTGGSKLQNSPPLDRKAPVSNSPCLEIVKTNKEHGKAEPEDVKTVPEIPRQLEVKPTVITESSSASELPPQIMETISEMPIQTELKPAVMTVSMAEAEESPLPPKGAYNFDFDNLDAVNPFQTGGAKLQNSPPPGRKAPVSNSPLLETVEPKKAQDKAASEFIKCVPEIPSPLEVKPAVAESTSASELPSKAAETISEMPSQPEVKYLAPAVMTESTTPSELPPKDSKMLLEFNFDDGAQVKRKPPPKRLGMKRPPGAKPALKNPSSVPAEKKSPEPKPQSLDATVEIAPVDIPVTKGSYNFDFDKFDDPNFNPFGTKAVMTNSPPRSGQRNPVTNKETQAAPLKTTTQTQPDNQPEQWHAVPESVQRSAEVEPSLTKTKGKEPCSPVKPEPAARKQTPEPCPMKQSAEFGSAAADEEFVPGSMFLPNDFDEQIDYLEQFGSSTFKESALRKQSLYLKFDPLVKESPKKTAAADSTSSGFCLPRPSLAIRMMEAAKSEVKQKSLQECPKLLCDFPPVVVEAPVVQDPTVLDLLVPTLKQPQKSEGLIVDVLKYSQKDMDAAMERARKQAEEKEDELKAEIEKMTMNNQHMVLIVSEFETMIAQITAEHKQKEELVQAELSKVFQEKQQLAKDLNDMERSFSDVVKRLDRRKEVIDGFKKNEETLKQCAQSYLAKLQKGEQRYQMLKTHAEEKIDQANKEIAEVRSKLGTEISALQVQLRREQLKVQSLEKNLEQKAKEVEDVTKLCDELIMKVQKH